MRVDENRRLSVTVWTNESTRFNESGRAGVDWKLRVVQNWCELVRFDERRWELTANENLQQLLRITATLIQAFVVQLSSTLLLVSSQVYDFFYVYVQILWGTPRQILRSRFEVGHVNFQHTYFMRETNMLRKGNSNTSRLRGKSNRRQRPISCKICWKHRASCIIGERKM